MQTCYEQRWGVLLQTTEFAEHQTFVAHDYLRVRQLSQSIDGQKELALETAGPLR